MRTFDSKRQFEHSILDVLAKRTDLQSISGQIYNTIMSHINLMDFGNEIQYEGIHLPVLKDEFPDIYHFQIDMTKLFNKHYILKYDQLSKFSFEYFTTPFPFTQV